MATTITEKRPSLWLNDLSPKELVTLVQRGIQRLDQLGSYYCDVFIPSYEAEKEQHEAREKEHERLKNTYKEVSKTVFDEASKILREKDGVGGCEDLKESSKLAYLQGKLDAIKELMDANSGNLRKRKFEDVSVSVSVSLSEASVKQRKHEKIPEQEGILDEQLKNCFVLFTRISGYCEELSQGARDKLCQLKDFAYNGSLKTWISEDEGEEESRLAMITGLNGLAVLIDKSLTRMCHFLRLCGLGAQIYRPPRELKPGHGEAFSIWVDSWYPILLKMEQMYPGDYIEDLQYIWYLIAEFNDYRTEEDSPKKGDFEGISFFGGGLASIASRRLMQYPPPVENLRFSITAIAEALLLHKGMTVEMMRIMPF